MVSVTYGRLSFSDDGTRFVFIKPSNVITLFSCTRSDISQTAWTINTVGTTAFGLSSWGYVTISGDGNTIAAVENNSGLTDMSFIHFYVYDSLQSKFVFQYWSEYRGPTDFGDIVGVSVSLSYDGTMCFITAVNDAFSLQAKMTGTVFVFENEAWSSTDILLTDLPGISNITTNPAVSLLNQGFQPGGESVSIHPTFILTFSSHVYAFYFTLDEIHSISGTPISVDGDVDFGASVAFSNIGCTNIIYIGSPSQNKVYIYTFVGWSIVFDKLLQFPEDPPTTNRGSSIYTTTNSVPSFVMTTSKLSGTTVTYVFSL